MSDVAIKVENISKRYRIGLKEELHDTFFGALASWVKYPLSNFRRVQKLSKFSGDGESEDIIWALKDISFEVKHGEVLGIIGKNGAGKSTLLKILCRITEPTSGNASIHGRVASLLEVGTGFHPELTGRENVFLNGTILGMKKAEIDRKFYKIVDFSGVEKFIDTPVKRYSSGMRVRLAFAVAAHLDPEILLIDEVLAVGDAEFQKKCLGKMKDISGEGRTVLFVSHNMGSIKQLCNRGILLSDGRIEMNADINEVVNGYIGKNLQSDKSEYHWNEENAPGDNSARLVSMRLCAVNGRTRTEFGTDEPIVLEIIYEIKEKLPVFRIGFSLHSRDGSYLFYTADDDRPEYAGMNREPGLYKNTCTIPSNWLNRGLYYLGLSGEIYNQKVVIKNVPPLSFSIISTGGATSRFNEKRKGFFAPTLDWEIKIIN